MYNVIFLVVIVFVVQGFFSLEEEMLIILAGVIWLDAAGGLIRSVLEKELVYKGTLIKNSFLWFLQKQLENVETLKSLHLNRFISFHEFSQLMNYFLSILVIIMQKRFFLNFYRLQLNSSFIVYKLFTENSKNEKHFYLKNELLFLLKNSKVGFLLNKDASNKLKVNEFTIDLITY